MDAVRSSAAQSVVGAGISAASTSLVRVASLPDGFVPLRLFDRGAHRGAHRFEPTAKDAARSAGGAGPAYGAAPCRGGRAADFAAAGSDRGYGLVVAGRPRYGAQQFVGAFGDARVVC